MLGVHPDYEVGLPAGAGSACSRCHVDSLFLAMPKVNTWVPMKVCWFGHLGLGKHSPVNDNLDGHGQIPI